MSKPIAAINATKVTEQISYLYKRILGFLTKGFLGILVLVVFCAAASTYAWIMFDSSLQEADNRTIENQIAIVLAAVPLAIQIDNYYEVKVDTIINELERINIIIIDNRSGKVSISNLIKGSTLEQGRIEGEKFFQMNQNNIEQTIPVEKGKTSDGKPKLIAQIYVYKRPFERDIWSYIFFSIIGSVLFFLSRAFLQFLWERISNKVYILSDKRKEEIALGENQFTEFKPALRWNSKYGQERDLENEAIKTVCGFLNQEGGKLFIGVLDNGAVVGITGDLQHFENKDNPEDRLLQHCYNIVKNHIGIDLQYLVKIEYESIFVKDELRRVLIFDCQPSPKPVLYKNCFYVRRGNRTDQLYGGSSNNMEDLKEVLNFTIGHFNRRDLVSRLNFNARIYFRRFTIAFKTSARRSFKSTKTRFRYFYRRSKLGRRFAPRLKISVE
jgi:Putative DNA-binding domain